MQSVPGDLHGKIVRALAFHMSLLPSTLQRYIGPCHAGQLTDRQFQAVTMTTSSEQVRISHEFLTLKSALHGLKADSCAT